MGISIYTVALLAVVLGGWAPFFLGLETSKSPIEYGITVIAVLAIFEMGHRFWVQYVGGKLWPSFHLQSLLLITLLAGAWMMINLEQNSRTSTDGIRHVWYGLPGACLEEYYDQAGKRVSRLWHVDAYLVNAIMGVWLAVWAAGVAESSHRGDPVRNGRPPRVKQNVNPFPEAVDTPP